ncbi:MAG: hypothetical protein Q9195_004978 [Heterodermia aff. obscurata]
MASQQQQDVCRDKESLKPNTLQGVNSKQGGDRKNHDIAMRALEASETSTPELDEATNNLLTGFASSETTLSYASVMGFKQDTKLVGDDYPWAGSIFYFEQGSRTSVWFSFNGLASIFGSLTAYGVFKGVRLHGSSIAAWKIFFLVTGLLTVAVGCLFAFIVPDSQLNARWLSKNDRRLAIERVRANQQGIGNKYFKLYQFKEALLDPLTWAFVLFSVSSNIPNGGLTNFFNQIIVSFGYTAEESLLYGAPGGAIEVIGLLFCGFLGDKTKNRIFVGCFSLVLPILGMLMIVALPLTNRGGRLAGFYMTAANPSAFVALLSLISSNVAGYTKKTTVAALYLIAYCVGNIVGAQTFRPQDAPEYRPAEITIICCWSLCMVDLLCIRRCYKLRNQAKAALREELGYSKVAFSEWMDLTDMENSEFRYSL